jgi:predicted dehydrogenase
MLRLNRRRFFEESLIVTAASAAAACGGQLVCEAEQTTPSSANDSLQHAVIGCRIRGRVHAKEFGKQPGVEISYVCDPDLELAEQLATEVEAEQKRRPRVVQDMRKIFDDRAVDTVSIAAPNHWHALASIWAMQAGKDVYVEKPVSHNVIEGRRMVQAARKTGRICQAGTQNRSSGALIAAAQYVRDGKLGAVNFARSVIYGRRGSIGGPAESEIPPQVDFNLWLGPATQERIRRPRLHYDWHWVWDTGNGELGNNNIHMVDICRWVMGLDSVGDSVQSIGGRMGYQDAGETPNTQLVVHRFGPATIIQEVRGLKTEPFSEKFKAGYVIHGSEGFIADSSLFDMEGKLVQTFKGPGENHFVNFIKAVRSRQREDLSAEILEGHLSSALCHLANISHRLGETVAATDILQLVDHSESHAEIRPTLTRMIDHLKDNGVELEKTPLTVGPLLQIDSQREMVVNHPGGLALLGREYRQPFTLPTEDQI